MLQLIVRNSFRHPLRTALTSLGIAVALFAFCFVRTIIHSWSAGVDASAKNRLITRNAVSIIFYLPLAHQQTIKQVPGVRIVGYGNWFGGVYKDEKFRFQQFAIDNNYLDVYPEVEIDSLQHQAWEGDKAGALLGKDIAEQFGLKVGDVMQLRGSIFPGMWQFTVSGIFSGREESVDTRTMFFHWDYLNDRNKAEIGRNPDHAGFYVIQLETGANPAVVSKAVDAQFANSFAETVTETETAFIQGFVSMSSTIISVITVVSFIVIGITLLVLANTMLMSYRERYREYAILKAIGFSGPQLMVVVLGEALVMAGIGFAGLQLLLIPLFVLPRKAILGDMHNFFPVFEVQISTIVASFAIILVVAVIGSLVPIVQVRQLRVSDGLRRLG